MLINLDDVKLIIISLVFGASGIDVRVMFLAMMDVGCDEHPDPHRFPEKFRLMRVVPHRIIPRYFS